MADRLFAYRQQLNKPPCLLNVKMIMIQNREPDVGRNKYSAPSRPVFDVKILVYFVSPIDVSRQQPSRAGDCQVLILLPPNQQMERKMASFSQPAFVTFY